MRKTQQLFLELLDAISFVLESVLDDERIPPEYMLKLRYMLSKLSEACREGKKEIILQSFLEIYKLSRECLNLLPFDERDVVEDVLRESPERIKRIVQSILSDKVLINTLGNFAEALLQEIYEEAK
ncbi:MAG: hypothetical protein ACTSX9_02105 [Candidatus Njordarchaeales archaeon]